MAKVTGPLMSLDASGAIGGTVVFSKWKGRNYTRLLVTPMNPQSQGQADSRSKMGAIGRALSFVLYPTKANSFIKSQFYLDAVAYAPAGQSWFSWAMKVIQGTAFSTWGAVVTAYAALSSPNKGIYETAAALIGLSAFNLSYGTQSDISAGAQLYAMVKFAIDNLGYTLTAGTLAAPDAAGLEEFVDYVLDTVA